MDYTLTPDTEIYANAARDVFLIVDFRRDGQVFYRYLKRGETAVMTIPLNGHRLPADEFDRQARAEAEANMAHRVTVADLDWLPVLQEMNT